MSNTKNLKGRVIKGGISLVFRQIVVAVLSLGRVLVTARILGPKNYGIATVSLGVFYFLTRLLRLGIHVYVIRQPDISNEEVVQIKALYTTLGATVCLLLWLAAPAIGWWTKQAEVTTAFRWLLPGLWMNMLSITSTSMLERELRFVQVGFIEALAQVVNYTLAIILVLSGWGYSSIIVGTVARFAILALLSYSFYPIPWTLRWHWKVVQPALQYGATYSVSDWVLSLKNLRVSLLVSRFASVEAAGIVGIAIRLVEQLSMLSLILRRMSISVMAKLRDDMKRTLRAISKGMAYQALLNGSLCAFFSVVSAWIIPTMFDERWLSSAKIFPFLAIGALAFAVFDLHSATLYAAGHNRDVIRFNFVYVGVLWLLSTLLVPRLGILGYGIAETGIFPLFYMLHDSLKRLCGVPNYRNAFWLSLTAIFPLFGGIFLPPVWGTVLFFLCYGLLFTLNQNVRNLPLELLKFRQPKSTSS